MKKFYIKKVLEQIPRLLSSLDRDPYSKNYGSFDRLYWAWKLKDFSDVTLQRGVYPLWLLYSNNFAGNIFFKNKKILEWIKSGIFYFCKIQHKNGSCDQAFPWEQSYGAVAFTLYPLIEVYQGMDNILSGEERKIILKHFFKSAQFLLKNNEVHGFISNHLAGAALALYNSGILFNDKRFIEKSNQLIKIIIKNQSSDGWYKEYTGPDPGYQTLATYYLAVYYKKLSDTELLNSLKRSIVFLSYFIHPDGSFGGEYGSRNTEIFYPAGFEILRKDIPLAGVIADKMYENIVKDKTATLSSMDAGNLIPLMTNYIIAYLESINCQTPRKIDLPWEKKNIIKYFPDSKIFIKGNENYYSILNGKKGGVFKIFDKKKQKLIWDDNGYVGKIYGRKYITTQINNEKVKFMLKRNGLEIETSFFELNRKIPTPFKFFIFRGLNLVLFRNIWIGNIIKKILVKMLITRRKIYPIWLRRKIIYYSKQIEIYDILLKKKKIKFNLLICGEKFSAIHMASAKYFQKTQLSETIKPISIKIEEFNQRNVMHIKNIVKIK